MVTVEIDGSEVLLPDDIAGMIFVETTEERTDAGGVA